MAERRYEFRVTGRLSQRARDAFRGMEIHEVSAQTVIAGDIVDETGVHEVLSLIQSLGLEVLSVHRVPTDRHQENGITDRDH